MIKTCLSAIVLSVFGFAAQAQIYKQKAPSTLLTPMDQQLKLDTNLNITIGAPLDKKQLFEKNLADRIRKASINANQTAQHEIFYSTMPVAGKKNGGSTDNMPIVKLSDTDTRYTMLIKPIDVVDPTKKEQPKVNP
ncbi:hypothetical protein [Mucilaginibacter sp. CSA2-8R]|uniref:hypothetical protein n=1 Tax=Mucilaginibacter sp. CSA2-8R TaxID=3141542 RepID=UPI00315E01F8